MMTNKEIIEAAGIIEDESDEQSCKLCAVHEAAYKLIEPEIRCSKCEYNCIKEILNEHNYYHYTNAVIGETNSVPFDRLEEKVTHTPTFICPGCKTHFILQTIPVQYNGNHDIYYTGGKDFLNDEDLENIIEDARNRMEPYFKNYTERLLAGEPDLSAWNVSYWCFNELERTLAEALYNKGLKR